MTFDKDLYGSRTQSFGTDLKRFYTDLGQFKGYEGIDSTRKYLKNLIGSGGGSFINDLRKAGERQIVASSNRAKRGIKDAVAGTGALGSGTEANAYTDIYTDESNALAGLNANVNQTQTQFMTQLVGQLGQLAQFDLGTSLSVAQSNRALEFDKAKIADEQDWRRFTYEDSKPGAGDIFGKILGYGVGAFTGGLGGGLAEQLYGGFSGGGGDSQMWYDNAGGSMWYDNNERYG